MKKRISISRHQAVHVLLIIFLFSGFPLIIYGNESNTPSTQKDEWIAIDKVQHFSYSCIIALGFQYVLVNKVDMEEQSALPVSLGLSFAAGFTKEIHDSKRKHGFFSKKDLVANGLGLITAGMIILYPSN